jgi:ABC-type transporter MlaC component
MRYPRHFVSLLVAAVALATLQTHAHAEGEAAVPGLIDRFNVAAVKFQALDAKTHAAERKTHLALLQKSTLFNGDYLSCYVLPMQLKGKLSGEQDRALADKLLSRLLKGYAALIAKYSVSGQGASISPMTKVLHHSVKSTPCGFLMTGLVEASYPSLNGTDKPLKVTYHLSEFDHTGVWQIVHIKANEFDFGEIFREGVALGIGNKGLDGFIATLE